MAVSRPTHLMLGVQIAGQILAGTEGYRPAVQLSIAESGLGARRRGGENVVERGMKGGEPQMTACPWCGAAVAVSGQSLLGLGGEGAFLRCRCGAVGMQTIEPEVDRLRVAEEVLETPRRLWADQAWGLENVEWRILEEWSRLQKLEELVSGQGVWVALLWGRRK